MIKLKIYRQISSSYVKNITVVMSGTIFAQIITLISIPFVTRLYSPELFGEYTVYIAIVNFVVILSTLKYDQAIFLPEEKKTAINILVLSVSLVLLFTTIILIVIIFYQILTSQSGLVYLNTTLYYIPILTMLLGLYYCLRNWLSREGDYKLISTGHILRMITMNSLFLIFGYSHHVETGLMLGTIIGQLIETVLIAVTIIIKDRQMIKHIRLKEIKALIIRYKDFPKYILISDIFSNLSTQAPIILLSSSFNASIVGNYSIAQRVFGIPIKLISGSTGEVFKKKAVEEKNKNGHFSQIYLKTFKMLLIIGLIPTIIFWLFLKDIVPIIFGNEWVEAGEYTRYLSLLFLFQFTISPLGFSLYISEKQKYELYWQILLFILSSSGILLGVYYRKPELSILLFSLVYSCMYILYFYWGYKYSKAE